MGHHHYDCISSISNPGSDETVCSRCDEKCNAVNDHQVDFFAGGFPCQPWSTQRQCHMRSAPPHEHHGLPAVRFLISDLLPQLPRSFLLENVIGLPIKQEYPGGQWLTGPEFLRQKLGAEYHISEVIIDLTPWVFMQRPRVWIFGIHKSIGTKNCSQGRYTSDRDAR